MSDIDKAVARHSTIKTAPNADPQASCTHAKAPGAEAAAARTQAALSDPKASRTEARPSARADSGAEERGAVWAARGR